MAPPRGLNNKNFNKKYIYYIVIYYIKNRGGPYKNYIKDRKNIFYLIKNSIRYKMDRPHGHYIYLVTGGNMNIPTFTPHEVTPQELEICKQLQEQQYLYCREHECSECPLFDNSPESYTTPCKILYTYQFCKEQRK